MLKRSIGSLFLALLTGASALVLVVSLADAQADQYATYSVLTLDKSKPATMTRSQLAWLRKIHKSISYHGAWKHLRFSMAPTGGIVPLVVYDDRDTNIVGAGAHIIGAPCDALFDPFRRGVFAGPQDAACETPTPKPVVLPAGAPGGGYAS